MNYSMGSSEGLRRLRSDNTDFRRSEALWTNNRALTPTLLSLPKASNKSVREHETTCGTTCGIKATE